MLRLLVASILLLCALPLRAEVQLLTSIRPLQLIAAAVQEGVAQPQVLLPPGASAHHYSLRPSDVRKVRSADLFYWVGPDLESFLPPVLKGRDGQTVALQDEPGLTLRHFGETDAEHADHSHDEDEHHDHAHRPGNLDAHLWLLPSNALLIAQRMAADLAQVDPANAAQYQANLAAFTQRISQLDRGLTEQLQAAHKQPFFVFHQAYDYFESAYGLQHQGVFSIGGEVQPGARHVAQMREALQQAGPACVFSEPPLQPKLAQTLSQGLPVTLAELDVMGADVALDQHGYERLMQALADDLLACLNNLPAR